MAELGTLAPSEIKEYIDLKVLEAKSLSINGKSAYQLAVERGFTGTEEEWLISLTGENGKTAYDLAVQGGFVGTEAAWLDSLKATSVDVSDKADVTYVNAVKVKVDKDIYLDDFTPDRTGTVDAGTAFQAAINSIPAGKTRRVYVSEGIYLLSTTPVLNGRYPYFVFAQNAVVNGAFGLPYTRVTSNGQAFDNGAFNVGSNDGNAGQGSLMIGGADFREINGTYIYGDGHPNWVGMQSSVLSNPTELAVYPNYNAAIVDTNGTNVVTRVSGLPFSADMVGNNCYIQGSSYTITAFTSSSSITVNTTIAAASGRVFHYCRTSGSGTCNTSGNTVTRIKGDPFVPFIASVDFKITINGTPYTIASYVDGYNVTVVEALPTLSGVSYSYSLNINDQCGSIRVHRSIGVFPYEENVTLSARPQRFELHATSSVPSRAANLAIGVGWDSDNVAQPLIYMVENKNTPGTKQLYLGGDSNDAAFRVEHTDATVNRFCMSGAPTGYGVGISAEGADANIGLNYSTKGAGSVYFTSNTFVNLEFVITSAAGRNYLGVASGYQPTLWADGLDTDISLKVAPKGAGWVQVGGSGIELAANQVITGGSAASSTLVLKGTTGAASTYGQGAIYLKVGNNGATTALLCDYNGSLGFGTSVYDAPNNRLGIGLVTPETQVQIATALTTTARGLSVTQHNGATTSALFQFKKSRGTQAAPVATQAGDFIGSLQYRCYVGDTNKYQVGAAVQALTTVNATDTTAAPATDLQFTTSTGSGATEKLRLTSYGEMKINQNTVAVGSTGITPDGGFYTVYTAAEALVAGDIVYFAQSGTADAVNKVPINGDMPCGVVYEGASANGTVKVVWGGRCACMFTSVPSPIKGCIGYVSATVAGQLDSSATAPATTLHFRECGHLTGASMVKESRTLYFIGNLHFN